MFAAGSDQAALRSNKEISNSEIKILLTLRNNLELVNNGFTDFSTME